MCIGSNLSQGQRQLISLARALLAPSNILVLDEATVSRLFLLAREASGSMIDAGLETAWSTSSRQSSLAPLLKLGLQAAVDVQTDALLQATLRSNRFNDKTIITIAHRINTILDSDRIVVLHQGSVAEFDTPANLVRNRGLFYDLVKEAGLLSAVEG